MEFPLDWLAGRGRKMGAESSQNHNQNQNQNQKQSQDVGASFSKITQSAKNNGTATTNPFGRSAPGKVSLLCVTFAFVLCVLIEAKLDGGTANLLGLHCPPSPPPPIGEISGDKPFYFGYSPPRPFPAFCSHKFQFYCT